MAMTVRNNILVLALDSNRIQRIDLMEPQRVDGGFSLGVDLITPCDSYLALHTAYTLLRCRHSRKTYGIRYYTR